MLPVRRIGVAWTAEVYRTFRLACGPIHYFRVGLGREARLVRMPPYLPICPLRGRCSLGPEYVDFVEEPGLWPTTICSAAAVREAKARLPASCGEDRPREGRQLRQFPQILGCGGQQELVFGSAWATETQSIEPEYALQVSEEHLDLLSFATGGGVGLGLYDRMGLVASGFMNRGGRLCVRERSGSTWT